MAVAEKPNPGRDWKKRESFTSAMVQVVLVGVVLAAAVYFFVQRGQRRKDVADRLKDAKVLALRDNPSDLKKASDELEAIFEIDGSAKDALALAADIETQRWLIHLEQGAEPKAREYLQKAESQDSRTEERYANAVLHRLADGKADSAEQYAEELRKQGASSAKLWYGLGLVYQQQGQLALARQAFAQATEKAWKNPRYFSAFGESLMDQSDYRTAIEMLTKGLGANPDHLRTKLNLALARIYRAERVKDAQDTVNEVIALPDLTPGLKARALAAQAELANFEKRYDDAVRSAEEALAINKNERYALLAKARALALKGDAGAGEAFKAAAAANKTMPSAYFTGAKMLQANGKNDEALALLDQYAEVFSKINVTDATDKTKPALERDDNYWIVRGDVLRAMGNQTDAMAAYEKAVAVDSINKRQAVYAKGALLLAQKKYDEALEQLEMVTPDDGTGQLAAAYKAKGDVLFAKEDYPAGCQNYAFALTRMKAQQAPREDLNALLESVTKSLIDAKQKNTAKLWEQEAKPLIQ